MTRHLCETAEAEIQGLQDEGISLSLDEIVWINDLSRKVENPDGGRPSSAIGCPAKAGNVWLWPFTIQAEQWYQKTIAWFNINGELATHALAFALAHARVPKAFELIQGYSDAKKAIENWVLSLACTHAELCEAMAAVLPATKEHIELKSDKKQEENEEVEQNWDDLIAWLVQHVGETPDFWTTFVSQDYLLTQIKVLGEQNSAEDQLPDPHDPIIVATRELGRAILKIKQIRADLNDTKDAATTEKA